ncbi:MAG TPA: hypothetical protein VMH49_00805 [Thermoplasmata archaeon]|nr:hypothetical protein [Thermoplasmata archaeon]
MRSGAAPRDWGGRLGAYAPVPFVGAASILVALIVFTPVLLASGPSPLALEAELVVYRTTGSASTEFYLHALGALVPYARLSIALGSNYTWNGQCPSSGLTWTPAQETDALELSVASALNPVVVNATAVYASGGSSTVYAAELAFEVLNVGAPDESLAVVACTAATPGVSTPGSLSVSELPHAWLLVDYGAGGPP